MKLLRLKCLAKWSWEDSFTETENQFTGALPPKLLLLKLNKSILWSMFQKHLCKFWTDTFSTIEKAFGGIFSIFILVHLEDNSLDYTNQCCCRNNSVLAW